MGLTHQLRELMTHSLGQQPNEGTIQACNRLCAAELHRVFGAVLSGARLSELSSRLQEGDFDSVSLLTGEFPWSGRVVDAVVEGVVHRAVERAGSSHEEENWGAWSLPPTTLEQGRALVRELVADRGGVQALEAWPILPEADASALRLITDRVEAEAGVRLAYLANRAGTLDVGPSAIDEVVASVIEDSGGAAGLNLWGKQLTDVDAAVVDGGTAVRVRLWSSTPRAEPLRSSENGKIKLDDELLNRCGLATLRRDERGALLNSMYAELETRAGFEMAEGFTDAELEEFGHIFDARDHDAASAWLAVHCPDYPQVVAKCAAAVEVELRDAAPTLLAALGTVLGAGV